MPKVKPNSRIVITNWGKLRAYLLRNGVQFDQVNEVLDVSPDTRTNRQVSLALRDWLRSRPKKDKGK